jgi:hypothetical protein
MFVRPESALRENIRSKGKNSYYYAHGHKLDGLTPPVATHSTWDGNIQPKLLKREDSAVAKAKEVKVPSQVISQYAWADDKGKVKVYVTRDEFVGVETAQVTLDSDDESFKLTVDLLNPETKAVEKQLVMFVALYAEISKCKFVKKTEKDRVVITLFKANTLPWPYLKDNTKDGK